MEPRFFAFDPRPTRRALFVGACALAILSAWALADARAVGNTPLSVVRAGFTGGLMLAFVFAWHRLRPRPGWGVTLNARGVQVARPFTGSQLQLSWGQIDSVRRLGGKGDVLGLFLDEGGRVLVTRHLFPSRAAYGELASALEERKPAPRYDA
ncbi:hypothetical protein [Vitiosangium sp. GDMCC 1.1324]|uniref:hypothetical protein n=1 Tax=Vitiosangium sp. (strain GDMCC 1.1324) TaxID=2138576 RepID=UPI000D38AC53|nr:hypothetical protein [Vitiosangium sp. GDMCC 1.1324]PTL84744.1 hypothetical protein DAT35_06680 [Vitiosangium sp. GDMCC 1.1324]